MSISINLMIKETLIKIIFNMHQLMREPVVPGPLPIHLTNGSLT